MIVTNQFKSCLHLANVVSVVFYDTINIEFSEGEIDTVFEDENIEDKNASFVFRTGINDDNLTALNALILPDDEIYFRHRRAFVQLLSEVGLHKIELCCQIIRENKTLVYSFVLKTDIVNEWN